MTDRERTSVGSEDARPWPRCDACHAPLTMYEHYPLCDRCELDYQHDTHADDEYPRVA